MRRFLLALLMASAATPATAAPLDANTVNRIADQGFAHSRVMQTADYLTDRIGGRITNSPAMREA